MKIRHLLIPAALVLGGMSCNEDIHDFSKQTASEPSGSIYIADSVVNVSLAWNASLVNSGTDTLWVKFPLHVSEPAKSDLKVALTIDNALLTYYNTTYGTAYNSFASGDLATQLNVTIAAGKTRSDDSVAIAYTKAMKTLLDTNGYMIPVRINTYSGTDAAPNYEERCSFIFVNITRENGFAFPSAATAVLNNPYLEQKSFSDISVKVASILKTTGASTLTLQVNNDLIADYNAQNGTDYQAVDPADFGPMELAFPANAQSAEFSIAYTGDASLLTDARGYLVPLEITSATGATTALVDGGTVFYAAMNINTLHGEYAANESDLGVKVDDRSLFTIVKLHNVVKNTAASISAPPTASQQLLKDVIFGKPYDAPIMGTVTSWMITGLSGSQLEMIVDLGAEIRNITGFQLSSNIAGAPTGGGANNMRGVQLYYSTEAQYNAGMANYMANVDQGEATQHMQVKMSEPITARYIRAVMSPFVGAVRLNNFNIYTQAE